jgi:hypothetical protein
MTARRQPTTKNLRVNRLNRGDEGAIQRYLDLVDDGELARLAAMMSPKIETFDVCALIAQAAALQAEASAELVRRREEMVKSMSLDTLSKLAGHLGIRELGFLRVLHEDSIPDDPIQGPVLRGVAALMHEMRPPQDFTDLFLVDNPTEALKRASSRTSIQRPLPDATLEELLRFSANISENVVSWDILNGAFIDFLRMWFQDRLDLEELILGGPDAGQKKSKDSSVLDRIEKLQWNRKRFRKSFKPGHEFPPDIVELAHRAYEECWENRVLGSQWLRRLAWLSDTFSMFWQRFGDAYGEIHKTRKKAATEAEANIRREQNEKSAKARKVGEVGLQRREDRRWKEVTADFIKFLKSNLKKSEGLTLSSRVDTFVETSTTLGKKQKRANTGQFLSVLCAAATQGKDAEYVIRTFQRPLNASIEAVGKKLHEEFLLKMTRSQRREFDSKGLVPCALLQNKNVTVEAVDVCLKNLKQALFKVGPKNSKK